MFTNRSPDDKWEDPSALSDYYREKADELRTEGNEEEADSYDTEADRMDQIKDNQDYERNEEWRDEENS